MCWRISASCSAAESTVTSAVWAASIWVMSVVVIVLVIWFPRVVGALGVG